jgi:hypothetical protein
LVAHSHQREKKFYPTVYATGGGHRSLLQKGHGRLVRNESDERILVPQMIYEADMVGMMVRDEDVANLDRVNLMGV